MEAPAPDAWSRIINAAGSSSLSVTALIILMVGLIALTFFGSRDKAKTKILVFVLLLLFFGSLAASVYNVRPVVPSAAVVQGAGAAESSPRGENASHVSPASPGPPAGVRLAEPRTDCGTAWTGWVNPGAGVGDPCPQSCLRGDELGQTYRVVGFPPRPQTKHKFQCWHR